jgi:hypothetical protein
VGEDSIRLDTMEHALAGKTPPDFIKTDAEGADLAILVGAETILKQSCVGLQVEASFVERHKGAPLFSDIDGFLRARGFVLHQLNREHWIRKNDVFGASSKPQVIWANAVYFASIDEACCRALAMDGVGRTRFASAFVAVLLVYEAHDYAIELVDRFETEGLIDRPVAERLHQVTLANVRHTSVLLGVQFGRLMLATCIAILLLPFPNLKRRAYGAVRRAAHGLADTLMTVAGRGEPARAVVTDFEP